MYGLTYQESNSIPSVTSSSKPKVCPSSTEITQSFPTFSIARAIISQTSLSCADRVATCAISSEEVIFLDIFSNSFSTSYQAFFIQFFISIAFIHDLISLSHSRAKAYVKRVAVVVQSHANSFVFDAASFTSSAHIFSNLSSSSISFAIVTQSFVT
jgi:hypothetical protein